MMNIENYKKKLEFMSREELLHEISSLISDYEIQLEQLKEEKKTLVWLNQDLKERVSQKDVEIERLTEERESYKRLWVDVSDKHGGAIQENAELQKQVDELKEENYNLARKIFGEMMGIWFALRQYCPVSEDIKFISNSNTLRDCISETAKKYGVEVTE